MKLSLVGQRFGRLVGVEVSDQWLGEHGFEQFLEDMSERPDGTTLGRYADTGPYAPGTCAWMTWAEQRAEAKKKLQSVKVPA